MKERTYTCPMSIHCTAAELAAIEASAAASGVSRNKWVKSTLAREVERLKTAEHAVSPTEVAS